MRKMREFRFIPSLVTATVMILLPACSGGGGSSPTDPGIPGVQPTPSAAVTPITFDITYTKGRLRGTQAVTATVTELWGAPGSQYRPDDLCQPQACFFIRVTMENMQELDSQLEYLAFFKARGSSRRSIEMMGGRLGKKKGSTSSTETQWLRFTDFEPGDVVDVIVFVSVDGESDAYEDRIGEGALESGYVMR